MTIHVKADKIRLHLWLPTSILKSRIGYKVVRRAIQDANEQSLKRSECATLMYDAEYAEVIENAQLQDEQVQQDKSANITRKQVLEIYKVLKRHVKQHGHFNLVEVESHDGEKVIIRV